VSALPLQPYIFEVKADQLDKVAEARQAVVDSIERGMPVQYGDEEDGIIFGYQKGGAEWLAYHPMRDGGRKPFVETGWPWGIAVYGPEEREVPPTIELARGAVEQALTMARTPEAGGYHLGFAAWHSYIARLTYLLSADEETRAGDQMGNAWIYECLVGFRNCAASYLRTVAPEFPSGASTHLRRAADLYASMTGEILQDGDNCVVSIAPYNWSLVASQSWSTDTVRAQIERLQAALPLEREAIGEIEDAIDLIEAGV
jgi:hypothetical protein